MTPAEAVKKSTWCVNPFLQAHQRMDSQLSPCCVYQSYMGNTINDYINSPKLKQLKTELLSDGRPAGCSKCWREESVGLESKRQRDNKTYQDRFRLIYHKKDLLEPNPNLAEYYIRLGNNCNLRCAICDDMVSTGWASENKKFGLPYHKKNNIRKDDPIWQHMLDHSRYIKLIEFIGGEPLFINLPLQIDFLEKLISTGAAKNIKLRYHTNGTKFNSDIVELWKYFDEVTVWLSIDGIEQSFEYQRYPAKWSVVTKIVDRFIELSKQSSNIIIKANCTVSVLNILDLDKTLLWFKEKGLEYHLNLLDSPFEYGLFNQELSLKQKIVEEINNPEIQNITNGLLVASEKTTTEKLKYKLNLMDQKRSLKYSDCLALAKLLDY